MLNNSHKKKIAYPCSLIIKGRKIKWIVVSLHYQIKHSSYMSDELIQKLVKEYLENNEPRSVEISYPWEYLTWEPLIYENKTYRLVACLHAKQTDFLGIVSCHRIRIKKNEYER